MNLRNKRYYLLFAIVCGLFFTLQPSTGTFENSFASKPVRISVSSQKFLKQVMSDWALILSKVISCHCSKDAADIIELGVQMSFWLHKQEFLTHDDLGKIQKILLLAKQCLARKALTVYADGGATTELFKKVKEALDVTTLRGFEPDVRYIKTFLNQLPASHKRRQSLDVIANISDIMRHFEGVLITDYDVVVLFQLALMVFLMAQVQ